MRTWSIESVLRGLEKLTRPPRRTGFDEQKPCDTGDCYHEAHGLVCPHHCFDDDTPNPTEPGLDDDELIGVRGLLQERYGDQSERADTQDAEMWRAFVDTDSSAASTVGDSAGEASGPSPVPPSPACPDDAAAEWIGGAVPIICGVLARHHPVDNPVCAGAVSCIDPDGTVHDEFGSPREWREFAARMIADRLAPQPAPASPCSDFAKGVEAAANIVAEEAQRIWREVLDAPDARPLLDGMSVAFGLDRLTQELRDHANEYALAPQPKPAFPETGLDMGARLDGASEFYPQHRKTK